MNQATRDCINRAIDELLLSKSHNGCDMSKDEHERVLEIVNELIELVSPKFIVTLEGWWWEEDVRKYAHIDDLHSYPCKQAAIDECDELADEQSKLVLAAATTGNSAYEGSALAVYERRGSESRAVQMYVLEYDRPTEFYWGDDAEHVAL